MSARRPIGPRPASPVSDTIRRVQRGTNRTGTTFHQNMIGRSRHRIADSSNFGFLFRPNTGCTPSAFDRREPLKSLQFRLVILRPDFSDWNVKCAYFEMPTASFLVARKQ